MRWTLRLDQTGARPKYSRLVAFIEEAIEAGRLAPGDRIPSVVELAERLSINKATVVRAFRELEGAGRIVSQVGRGSYVADAGAARPNGDKAARLDGPGSPRLHAAAPEVRDSLRRLRSSFVSGLGQLLNIPPPEGAINLGTGVPSDNGIPSDLLAELVGKVLAENPERVYGYAHAGLPEFRSALTEWLRSRGYSIRESQILVTNGSQEALTLVANWSRERRRRVFCESPSYIGVPLTFSHLGHVVENVPLLTAERLGPRLARLVEGQASTFYCCPEFQNPTGLSLPDDDRAAIAELARREDLVVVVDDLFRDMRFAGEERESFYDHLPPNRRLLVGSFSKSFMPGLRAGFLVADESLLESFHELKRYFNLGSPPLTQALMARFLDDGGYARHLKRMRTQNKKRRDAAVAAMERHFPDGVSFTRPDGGFQLWVTMPVGYSSIGVYLRALERGVLIHPGPGHDIDGRYQNCFRIGYGVADVEQIERGIAILGAVLTETLAESPEAPNATGLGPL